MFSNQKQKAQLKPASCNARMRRNFWNENFNKVNESYFEWIIYYCRCAFHKHEKYKSFEHFASHELHLEIFKVSSGKPGKTAIKIWGKFSQRVSSASFPGCVLSKRSLHHISSINGLTTIQTMPRPCSMTTSCRMNEDIFNVVRCVYNIIHRGLFKKYVHQKRGRGSGNKRI